MSNVPILGEKPKDQEPMFRLLYCLVCQSLDELPPYDGEPELEDHLLAVACEAHVFPSGFRASYLFCHFVHGHTKNQSERSLARLRAVDQQDSQQSMRLSMSHALPLWKMR